MVPCYRRLMYVLFTVSQTMEHFLDAHQKAFEFFGGVPAKIMVDNLRSAVLQSPTSVTCRRPPRIGATTSPMCASTVKPGKNPSCVSKRNAAASSRCRQFRVTLDTNRYSVPSQYAGMPLTLKIYPDRLCLYDRESQEFKPYFQGYPDSRLVL